MPAATAIAPSAVPGANPANAAQPNQAGAQGAGDLFAVLVGLVGEDKSAQPPVAQSSGAKAAKPAKTVEDKAVESGTETPKDAVDPLEAQADDTTVADASLIVAEAVVAPPAPTPPPAVAAPSAPANDFTPASPPPEAEAAPLLSAPVIAPQDLPALAAAPANDMPVEAPTSATEAAKPIAAPTSAPAPQLAAKSVPNDAPSSPAPAAPVQLEAASAPTGAAPVAPAVELPPSIAATVANARAQPAAPVAKPTVASKTVAADGRSASAENAVDAAPSANAAGSPVAAKIVVAVEGEAAAGGEADFAAMEDPEFSAPVGADADAETSPTPAPLQPNTTFAATAQGAGGTVGAGTVSHLAAQMLQKLDGKATRFEIQLDPLGLGKVNVAVQIDARGRLSAAMTFENPGSAEALKARAGDLRQALEQAGFDLSGAGLTFDSDLDAGFAGGRWGDGEQAEAQGRGKAFGAAALTADTADQSNPALAAGRAARGLDIRI